jgi:hypothetical protein
MKWIVGRLNRLLSALALAEAGDLDTVRLMLREDADNSRKTQEAMDGVTRESSQSPVVPAA